MWKLSISILLLAAPAFAQLESHTLAVTASRSLVLQPDQILLSVVVNSGPAASLDQIAAALSGVGITSDNLASLQYSGPTTLQWGFTLAVPISKLAAITASLGQLQQTIGQNDSGLALTYSVNGTQVSQQQRQSQTCSNSDLISDATAQARKLAAAAGLTLGPVLRLSESPSVPSSVTGNVALAAIRTGVFADFLLGFPSLAATCSLIVKFQLLP